MIDIETTALCLGCDALYPVPARLKERGRSVWLIREKCRECGDESRTRVSLNPASFQLELELCKRRASVAIQPPALVLELLDECNMRCPICIANSGPNMGNVRAAEVLMRAIDVYLDEVGSDGTILLSGGEPTIHPQFEEILLYAAGTTARKVVLVTNGVRIAQNSQFCNFLQNAGDRLEVHLQFDTFEPGLLFALRGLNDNTLRTKAFEELSQRQIPTTLVVVVARNLTDRVLADSIGLAARVECVTGITFQPLRMSRGRGTLSMETAMLPSEVVDLVNSHLHVSDPSWLRPNRLAPVNVWEGHLQRVSGGLQPRVTGLRELPGLIYVDAVDERSSTPMVRVTVLSHFDRATYCLATAASTSMFTVLEDGGLVPLDQYYIFGGPPRFAG